VAAGNRAQGTDERSEAPEGSGQMGGTVVVMAVDRVVVVGNRARRGERTNVRSASEPRRKASDRRTKHRRGDGGE
jgi:hypothetical protein